MRPIYIPSDQTLVTKVRGGDRKAFGRLVDRHGAQVFHLLRRLTNSTESAEDLTQETFVSAFAAIETWRGDGAFSTWLCGIAVRRYRLLQRWNGHQLSVESLDQADSPTPFMPNDDPLAHYKRREAEAALAEAVAALSESCRDVFVLVRIEGMSYQTVADLLDIPLGTVQSRLSRATKFLCQRLSPFIYGTDPVAHSHSPKGANHDVR